MFHKFCRQLMHSSLVKMLESLKPGMTTQEVVHCADDHFHQAIYSLGPYIGDYPKQTALACVVQNWCPKSVINQFRYSCLCLWSLSRCTAPVGNLDGERYPPRSKEHTELISAEFELGQLWDEYGLIGDVVVIIYLFILIFLLIFHSHLQTTFPTPIFMNYYHPTYFTSLSKAALRTT